MRRPSETDMAGPEATRRNSRPVGTWPKTREQMDRDRVRRSLHATGAEYGLTHADLSDLADCSLATVHTDEMRHLLEQIPIWDAGAKKTGEDAVCSGLITHMETARTPQEVEQSWKLYSRLYLTWNQLTQLRAQKGKKMSLQRINHEQGE